jgi:hypothetical protein
LFLDRTGQEEKITHHDLFDHSQQFRSFLVVPASSPFAGFSSFSSFLVAELGCLLVFVSLAWQFLTLSLVVVAVVTEVEAAESL